MDHEDFGFRAEHPDPTDEDIADLCNAWVGHQHDRRRSSRGHGQ
jgi:hypothetical protein